MSSATIILAYYSIYKIITIMLLRVCTYFIHLWWISFIIRVDRLCVVFIVFISLVMIICRLALIWSVRAFWCRVIGLT